jgi:HTH-type transcriptional regulator/antitoxin HigA
LRVSDLLSVFGTRGRASEILQKRRRMSLDMMRGFHRALEIPLETLARDYKLKPAKRKAVKATKAARKRRAA